MLLFLRIKFLISNSKGQRGCDIDREHIFKIEIDVGEKR